MADEDEGLLGSIERREDLLAEIHAEQKEAQTEAAEDEREPCHVIEVDWLLREADGRLTYTGFRVVTGKPQQNLSVEVLDVVRGIQSRKFRQQCMHVAKLMGLKECDLLCLQDTTTATGS